MQIEKLMQVLEEKRVHVVGTTDDFFSSENVNCGIWISAESTPKWFNYYSTAWADTFGIAPELCSLVEEAGWYFEWYDAGTIMVWEA